MKVGAATFFIRDLSSTAKALCVVHSSDNSLEAIDYLEHLGLAKHPEIMRRLQT
ncbi:MAG: hypothetical protein WCI17_11245 [bacterium]